MKFCSSILLFLFCFFALHGQTESIQKVTQNDTLMVGYAGSAPFVIKPEGSQKPTGIVFDIWEEVAFSLGRQYQLQSVPSIGQGISAINSGKLDLLIGPITINSERAAKVSFSQPYFDTELALLAPVMEATFWSYLQPFLSSTFLFAILGLLLALFFVGLLFWLIEARHFPDDYPKKTIHGIGIGAWLAVVTMTTVGYGDFAPKTARGRVLIGCWMITSLILATTFVAGIATTFSSVGQNNQTITSLNQMRGKNIAVPSNQRVVGLIRAVGGEPVEADDASHAYSMLINGKVDAVLYDEVPLEYVFESEKKEDFLLSKENIDPQHYGFVLPKTSQLKGSIDQQIIRMREAKEINRIISEWVEKK